MSGIALGRRSLALSAAAMIVTIPVVTSPARAASSGAFAPVEALDAALLRIMKQGTGTPFQTRVSSLAPALDEALNLAYILRISIGARWMTLTPPDQQRLLAVFREYTLATYVEAFDSYNGQRIEISPHTRELSDGAQVVRSEIIPRSGASHYIDYVMRRGGTGAWQATDVLADGTISRIAVLRSDFSSMLERGGASALEASLQRKTAALASG